MPSLEDYRGQETAWCPGCGNFAILKSFKESLAALGIEPAALMVVSGIGQAAKFPHYIRCNTFNGLHGRTLPVATGIRLANHKLLVCAVAGDGDCYGEGGNHLVHAIRRNVGVKLFVHDNQVYGLTKGQASPTSTPELHPKNVPFGVISDRMNPLAMAVALDCSFVARGYAADGEQLGRIIREALTHRGFSLVDILQPCVSFNKVNTYEWYSKRAYRLEAGYDPSDRMAAFAKALEWGDRIPTGIIYRHERETFEERIPVISDLPLVEQEPLISKIKGTMKEYY